jgi:hypothetical protein
MAGGIAIRRSLAARRRLYSRGKSGAGAAGAAERELMEWARFLAFITGSVDQELPFTQ